MRTARFLGQLLNVRSGEWPRLSLLYAMALINGTGYAWSSTVVHAAFLQRVGVQYLPWVFVSSAALSFVALFVYTAFADRVSNTRLLVVLAAMMGGAIVPALALLAAGAIYPAYLLLYLVFTVPTDVFGVHWGTYINGFYDTRAAKRIVPLLGTAGRVSAIVGGLTMPLLNRALSPSAIVLLNAIALAIMAALALAMPRLVGPGSPREAAALGRRAAAREPRAAANTRQAAGRGTRLRVLAQDYREGSQQVLRSPFLRWMALSTLCLTLLMPFLTYWSSAIFQSELKTTEAISNFTGLLSGVANLVILPFQLFLLSRLIARLGLGNAGLIFPFTSLASVGALVVTPSLGSAALAFLDRSALRSAFYVPAESLFYNAVPQRVKARTRAFVGGLLVPIGAIGGGLLLLTPLMHTFWFLPAMSLLVALALILAALMVRRYYGKALVELLEQEDYSSLALQAPSQEDPSTLFADPATLARLTKKLSESLEERAPERTVFVAQLITAVAGEAAVPVVSQVVRATTDSRLRSALVDVLVAADVRRGGVRDLYAELLADGDPQVRLSALAGLEQIDGPRDPRYLQLAARLLADPEVEVRLRVLPALLAPVAPVREEAAHAEAHAAATAELRGLLTSPDPHTRARAVRVVGEAHASGFMLELVRSLTDPEDEVRLAAGLATEELARDPALAGKRDMLLALALLLLHDPVERSRVSAVTVLDRLSEESRTAASAARESSVLAFADPSREVRRLAVETLVHAGRPAIPPVREQLDAPDPHRRKMAAVVLARIDTRKYGSLVLGANLDDNLRAIHLNLACMQALACGDGSESRRPVVDVLSRELSERNEVLIEEIFYLLTAISDPVAIQAIARGLRSPQPEVRADATEALESLTAPQTAALVGPLLEPERRGGPPRSLPRLAWGPPVATPVAALRVLLSDAGDPWQRTLAAAALAELSKSAEFSSSAEPSSSAELSASAEPPSFQGEMAQLLELARNDPDADVRAEVRVASDPAAPGGLPLVRRVAILKDLPFFRSMLVEQLRDLARVCEERFFPRDTRLFHEGDPGGTLFLVARGRVGIERERHKGSFARLATVEAGSYLGESEFFNSDCRAGSAIAIQDTLALVLRREPLIALARQQPDLSLELINALSDRLREANQRIAELTRVEPEQLQKLYDDFDS